GGLHLGPQQQGRGRLPGGDRQGAHRARLARLGVLFAHDLSLKLEIAHPLTVTRPQVGHVDFSAMSETAKAPVDVFEKARSHDRLEQLEAAKEHDLLPYFRLLTSQAGPVVEMEGRE